MIVDVRGTGGLADLVRDLLPASGHELAPVGAGAAEREDGSVGVVVDVVERGTGEPPPALATRASSLRRLLRTPDLRIGRLVLLSSVLVYAPVPDPADWPITESYPRRAHGDRASRLFGQACLEAEDLMVDAWKGHGVEFVVLRPTVLAGSTSGSYADDVLDDLAGRPWAGARRHRGAGTMQWLDVRDAAEAVVLAVDAPAAAGEAFNLAGDDAFTAAELAGLLASGRTPDGPAKFDTTKARVLLGWQPQHRIAEIVEVPRRAHAPIEDGREAWR